MNLSALNYLLRLHLSESSEIRRLLTLIALNTGFQIAMKKPMEQMFSRFASDR
jgi:hypothetical protein